MPRLTVQVNEGNQPALGIEVIIQLAQPDRFRTSGAQVDNRPITAHTNLQGLAVFDLPASTEYVGQSLYSVRVAKSKPVSFAMPAQRPHPQPDTGLTVADHPREPPKCWHLRAGHLTAEPCSGHHLV